MLTLQTINWMTFFKKGNFYRLKYICCFSVFKVILFTWCQYFYTSVFNILVWHTHTYISVFNVRHNFRDVYILLCTVVKKFWESLRKHCYITITRLSFQYILNVYFIERNVLLNISGNDCFMIVSIYESSLSKTKTRKSLELLTT